jgi:uracil phosphoribosyltransferase
MVDPILNLIPTAEVWHLGLYRDEATALPVEYYSKLPPTEPVDLALVVDPMLATGGSAAAALAALARWGVKQLAVLSIIATKPGIQRDHEEYPNADI